MQTIAQQLLRLIGEIRYEEENLENMVRWWNEHQDPGSDPGLQWAQGVKIRKMYKEFFAKSHELSELI